MGLPRIKIQETIQTLFADGAIDEAKTTSLMELVQSLSGGLLDTDKVSFSANAKFIAKGTQNVAAGMTIPEAEASLKQREVKIVSCGTIQLVLTVVMTTWVDHHLHNILQCNS